MSEAVHEPRVVTVLKALGDPVRWNIVNQIAAAVELPCATLENTLPMSKPTISYHVKILQQADLVQVRKEGRKHFYSLASDVVREAMDELAELLPRQRSSTPTERAAPGPQRSAQSERGSTRRTRPPAHRHAPAEEIPVLTW